MTGPQYKVLAGTPHANVAAPTLADALLVLALHRFVGKFKPRRAYVAGPGSNGRNEQYVATLEWRPGQAAPRLLLSNLRTDEFVGVASFGPPVLRAPGQPSDLAAGHGDYSGAGAEGPAP